MFMESEFTDEALEAYYNSRNAWESSDYSRLPDAPIPPIRHWDKIDDLDVRFYMGADYDWEALPPYRDVETPRERHTTPLPSVSTKSRSFPPSPQTEDEPIRPLVSLQEYTRHKALDSLLRSQRHIIPRIVFPLFMMDHALAQERDGTVGVLQQQEKQQPKTMGVEEMAMTEWTAFPHSAQSDTRTIFPETASFFKMVCKQRKLKRKPTGTTTIDPVQANVEFNKSIMSTFPRRLPARKKGGTLLDSIIEIIPESSTMLVGEDCCDPLSPSGFHGGGAGKFLRLFLSDGMMPTDWRLEATDCRPISPGSQSRKIVKFIRDSLFVPDFIGLTCRIIPQNQQQAILRIFSHTLLEGETDIITIRDIVMKAYNSVIKAANAGDYASIRVRGAAIITEAQANAELAKTEQEEVADGEVKAAEGIPMEIDPTITAKVKPQPDPDFATEHLPNTSFTAASFKTENNALVDPAPVVLDVVEEVIKVVPEGVPAEVTTENSAHSMSARMARSLVIETDDKVDDHPEMESPRFGGKHRMNLREIQEAFEGGTLVYPSCDQCKEEAWWWCEDCGVYTCLSCDISLHVGRMMASHAKALLPGRRLKVREEETKGPMTPRKSSSSRKKLTNDSSLKKAIDTAPVDFYAKGATAKFLSASITVKKNRNKFVLEGPLKVETSEGVEVLPPSWNQWAGERRQRNYHAVIIAISHFYDNSIVPLPTALRDGNNLRDLFLSAGYSVDYLYDGHKLDFLIPTLKNINRVLDLARSKVNVGAETLMVVYMISRGAFGVCQGLSQKDHFLLLATDTILSQINSQSCIIVENLAFDRDMAGRRAQVFVDAWALPSVPFATTIPALGFCFFGGRSSGSAELTALYTRAVAGGVFTYYFLKGSKGYACAHIDSTRAPKLQKEEQLEDSILTPKSPSAAVKDIIISCSHMCNYIASKLQSISDSNVRVDSSQSALLLFPDKVIPMSFELTNEKERAKKKRVRISMITRARCGDAAKNFAFDQSTSLWQRNVWEVLLQRLCNIDEIPRNTQWPKCPLRIAYCLECPSTLQVRFRDLSELLRDSTKAKALEYDVAKLITGMRLKDSEDNKHVRRQPWFNIRTSDSSLEFICHNQKDVLYNYRNVFLGPNNAFSKRTTAVCQEVTLTIVLSEYHVRRLDKMIRLGTFNKQFFISDLIVDTVEEDIHDATTLVQNLFRAFKCRKRYQEQKAVMDHESHSRFIVETQTHVNYNTIVLRCYNERKQVLQEWETVQRQQVFDTYINSLRQVIKIWFQNMQRTEIQKRRILHADQLVKSCEISEISRRLLLQAEDELRRKHFAQLKKVQEMQMWERFYVEMQEFQAFLIVRNLARSFLFFRLSVPPPLKPVNPKRADATQMQPTNSKEDTSSLKLPKLQSVPKQDQGDETLQLSKELPQPMDKKKYGHMLNIIRNQNSLKEAARTKTKADAVVSKKNDISRMAAPRTLAPIKKGK